MTLSRERWIVRLFFFSVRILDTFTEGDREWRIGQNGTTLCFFFQATFIWAPLVLLLHLVVYGAILAALVLAPIFFFGLGTFVAILGGLATLASLIFTAGAVRRLLKQWKRGTARPTRKDMGPSSVGIVWSWLAAQKQKVCPMISFNSAGSR